MAATPAHTPGSLSLPIIRRKERNSQAVDGIVTQSSSTETLARTGLIADPVRRTWPSCCETYRRSTFFQGRGSSASLMVHANRARARKRAMAGGPGLLVVALRGPARGAIKPMD